MERILLVDFGGQFTQLIARRIREAGVFCEIYPFTTVSVSFVKKMSPKGIILSGGPKSVYQKDSPRLPKEIFLLDIPILGICYGQQFLCHALGGKVASNPSGQGEFGRAQLNIVDRCALFKGIWQVGDVTPVWMSHRDKIVRIPNFFSVFATSTGAPYACIANEQKNIYGLQFHPEVVHTKFGEKILQNFVATVCRCDRKWTMKAFKEQTIKDLQNTVKDKKVVCAVSGGVDSTVVAVLLHLAIGDNLTCIFVDNGLLRRGEAQWVLEIFNKHYNIRLRHCNAQDMFFRALSRARDPEKKRKIIGETFIRLFEREASKIGSVAFLAQGTLYPDVIESVTFARDHCVAIKSHHNVGGLPEKMHLALIEPLKKLFKDEVRHLARALNLPREFVYRHPFPGPGLAVRIPGIVTRKKCDILRRIDDIFIDQIRSKAMYDKIWQAFAVLLPIKSVGVMGDARTYHYACSLRAVTSSDGMTADVYPFDNAFLTETATRIINEVSAVGRVLFDCTSKPPGTIEWE